MTDVDATKRPRMVTAAAVAMMFFAVLAIAGGLVALASVALSMLFFRAIGESLYSGWLIGACFALLVIVIGVLEAYAARRVLSGGLWASRVGLTISILLVFFSAFATLGSVYTDGSPSFWPVLAAVNVLVAFALVRTGGWFAYQATRRPADQRDSILRLLRPWAALAVGFIAVVVIVTSQLQAWGQ